MSDDFERDRLAQELRASLARHAAEAPRGDALAERIIHAADQNAADARETQRRGWRGWALPAIAAAAVAGVVLAVVGIENYHPHHAAVGSTNSVTPTVSLDQSTLASPGPTHTSTPPAKPADLTNVKIIDLTFEQNEGWAIATADCKTGSGRCTALLHTADGTDWKNLPATELFDVPGVTAGCAQESPTCVSNIRFATADTGYAFGPNAFYMTTDGGTTWRHMDGGAIQLETLDHNVIRVTTTGSGCPWWCNVAVETAPVGSTVWTPAPLPTTPGGFGVQLARDTSGNAYLLAFAHTSGGASGPATSTLYRSSDDGQTWAQRAEPCPQQNGEEVDSTAIAAGGAGRVSVLCATRQAPQHWFVATSTDAGAHFSATPGTVPAALAPTLLTGDPNTVLVAAGNGMARSADGGVTWQRIRGVTGTVTFVGFESDTDGRAVTDGNTIWTTTDAGKHWTPAPFS